MKTYATLLLLAATLISSCEEKNQSNSANLITLTVGQTKTAGVSPTEPISLSVTLFYANDLRCGIDNDCSLCYSNGVATVKLVVQFRITQAIDTVILTRVPCVGSKDFAIGDPYMDVKAVGGVKIGLVNITGERLNYSTRLTIFQ